MDRVLPALLLISIIGTVPLLIWAAEDFWKWKLRRIIKAEERFISDVNSRRRS